MIVHLRGIAMSNVKIVGHLSEIIVSMTKMVVHLRGMAVSNVKIVVQLC